MEIYEESVELTRTFVKTESTNPGTEEAAISFIDRWNKLMEQLQKGSKIPISASVGYACGRYADINEIISEADERMYENKRVRRE